MKTFNTRLEVLKSEAQQELLKHFNEQGKLNFSERQLSFENGGWRQSSYIDKDDLYKLSAKFVCNLADEMICGF